MNKLISYIVPSRRLNDAAGFLDSLEETTANPDLIEVLFKFDNDQPGIKEFIEAEIQTRPFPIKYIITPRLEGNYSLWLACNKLFFMSSKETYFAQALSDEVRIKTVGWDNILQKYIGFFPDHVFRLRTSTQKLCNYYTQFECNYIPDSFPIYTRHWLTLTEGFGDCWGSDAYQQAVAFHMGLGIDGYKSTNRKGALYRDISIYDEIKYEGIAEYGVDISEEQLKLRTAWIHCEWDRLVSYCKQEEFSYYARKIYLYVLANKRNIKYFRLIRDEARKKVLLMDLEKQQTISEVSYAVPFFYIFFTNLRRKLLRSSRGIKKVTEKASRGFFYCVEYVFYIPRVIFSMCLFILGQSILLPISVITAVQVFLHCLRLLFKAIEYVVFRIACCVKNMLFTFVNFMKSFGKKTRISKLLITRALSQKAGKMIGLILPQKDALPYEALKKSIHKHCVEKSIKLKNLLYYYRRRTLNKCKNILQLNIKQASRARKNRVTKKFFMYKLWLQKMLIDKPSSMLYQFPISAKRIFSAKEQGKTLKELSGISKAMRLGVICDVSKEELMWAVGEIKEEYATKEKMRQEIFALDKDFQYDQKRYPDLGYW